MTGRAARLLTSVRDIDRRLTRRDDCRRVLFNARTPMNYAIVAPVRHAMARDARVEFYFTAGESPASGRDVLRDAGPQACIISPRRAALMRFDAYIAADLLWLTLPRGAPRVQMFHGVAGKYAHDYDRPSTSMRHWNRLFFINRRRMRNFIEAGAIDSESTAARLIGMPKVDCLVDGSLNRDRVLASLKLDPARPTVLYAPTWSSASSINRLGLDLIARLLDGPWNLIVKLHDRLCDPRPFFSGGINWGEQLGPMLRNDKAHLAVDADICRYLVAADVLITDHSSAGFEYLLLDRPLVRIHLPELLERTNINREYVDLLSATAASANDVPGIVAAVEKGLADPRCLSPTRTATAGELFYGPGGATTRAVEALYELMGLTPLVAPRARSAAAVAA